MAFIQTVCGGIDSAALGHCQIHEHIFVRPTPMAERTPAMCMDDFDRSLAELRDYKRGGGCFLVDAQPLEAGRDAEALQKLSAQSGVHIVASTGYHLLGFYPENSWTRQKSESELYAIYKCEAEKGMFCWSEDSALYPPKDTRIRAGMVKAAIPKEGPVGRYEVLLRAAARAAANTGLPLMLHTERGENTLAAIALCRSQGLRPEKIVVCHVDRQAADFAVHEAIAATGVYLDYDTIGRFKYHSDEDEVALLAHMCAKGYENKILLSLDTTAARLGAYGGEISLRYILDTFLLKLRAAGFSEGTLTRMTCENCRKLFAD